MSWTSHLGSLSSLGSCSDRALYSPDLPSYSTSPQSSFMYEHDDGLVRGKICENVFESEMALTEDNKLGGELDSSFWNDTTSMLETSFGDSVKPSLWDFSGFDDISSPLQHPEDDLSYSPTLAELNADDCQDVVRSSCNTCINVPKTLPWMHLGSNSVTGSNPLKTQCSVAGPSAADVTMGRDAASAIQEAFTSLDSPSIRSHSAHLSTKLRGQPSKEKRVKSVQRLTLKTQPQFHHHHHHSAKLSKKSRNHLDIRPGQDRESIEQKWKNCSVRQMMNGGSSTLPDKKTVFIKEELTPRGYSSGGTDGYDSHDEGLGSEHEDQDDEDSDNDNEEEGLSDAERDADAHSDMSEDHGVATTSAASPDVFPQKVKSRRSEYDDLMPNPKRLLTIANELHKLNKVISGMVPVSALPVSARSRSRKEKNKLASRACRLKKKAQHETNKLKLYGLEKEYDRLMQVKAAIKREILIYLDQQSQESPRLSEKLDSLIKSILGQMVANHTQEYVNGVLERTGNGSKLTGGLNFLKNHE